MSIFDDPKYKALPWWEKAIVNVVGLIVGHGVRVLPKPSGPRPAGIPAPPRINK